MVFSSAVFLFVFFPIVLILYFLPVIKDTQKDLKKKNIILFLSSLVFYAWGEPIYIVLMLISIFFNYNLGIDIEKHMDAHKKAKALMCFGVVFNLFMLGFFKYSGFLVENFANIFDMEIKYNPLPLPVGISFYTFQILSYVIDVYKGEVKAQHSFVAFGAYISMFPQLIAGPIVQYKDIDRQLFDRTVTVDKFYDGIIYFIKGLGKKVLFANTIGAVYSEIVAGEISSLSAVSSWIAVIAYTLQIYFDFSGYSDMAVGLGKMMGFEFVQNFNFPYKATSIKDFWSRWHISLSTWFRDYVYIPLGGNRKGTARTILNTLIVWSLTGLWHGAAWNFIAWGAFYGILLILEKFVLKDVLKKIPMGFRYAGTIIVVMLGWVLFSAESLGDAVTLIGSMIGFGGSFIDSQAKYLLSQNIFLIVIMSLSAVGDFDKLSQKNKDSRLLKGCKSIFYLGVFALCIAYLISESYNPFLYFRF